MFSINDIFTTSTAYFRAGGKLTMSFLTPAKCPTLVFMLTLEDREVLTLLVEGDFGIHCQLSLTSFQCGDIPQSPALISALATEIFALHLP